MDRGVTSLSPGRQPAGRLSVSQRRLGVQCVFVLTGTVDLAGAPRLGELLEQAARSRDPLVLDLSHAGPRGAVDMALLVHVVRWVYRRHPDLRIVCPPGPTRAALERSEVHARVEIVADRRALSATSSPPWRSDARARSARGRSRCASRARKRLPGAPAYWPRPPWRSNSATPSPS